MRVLTIIGMIGLCAVTAVSYGQRHQRKQAALEESAKPGSVSGGTKFQVVKTYADTYEQTLNYLKRADYVIDSADKDTGQIITGMVVSGGYNQTGRRLYVVFIKDSDTATTLRVAVADQKRKKLLQTEPWSDPKVNEKESEKVAAEIKAALQ